MSSTGLDRVARRALQRAARRNSFARAARLHVVGSATAPRNLNAPRPSCCAVCVGDLGHAPRQEPIGRDDGLVWVCSLCATEKVTEQRGPERAYEPVSFVLHKRDRQAVDRAYGATVRARRSGKREPAVPNMRWSRLPNHALLRVPITRDGKVRDAIEALADFADRPYRDHISYVGTTNAMHVFQVPQECLR